MMEISEIISATNDLSSPVGYIALFIVVLISNATIIFPLPIDTTIVFTAGPIGNPILVGLIAGIGAAIGELSSYFVARGGEKVITKYVKEGDKYDSVKEQFKKYGFWAIPVFAFTPLPLDLIGLAAGALKYDLKKFFLGVLIGKVPRYLIIAFAGYYAIGWVPDIFGGWG